MKTGNVIQGKSYAFAVKIVKHCRFLMDSKKEYILSKQLLRSGTSIGANIEEARESKYWIRLLFDSGYTSEEIKTELLKNVEELLRIIGSIQKTIRNS